MLPSRSLERSVYILRHPGLRVYVCRLHGPVFDAGVALAALSRIPTSHQPTRAAVTCVLEGAQVVRGSTPVFARAGQTIVEGRLELDERWEGPRYRSLTVEWSSERGHVGGPMCTVRTSPRLADAARTLADLIEGGSPLEMTANVAVADFVSLLIAEGVPLYPVDPLVLSGLPDGAHSIAAAVRWADTHLHEKPQWTDIDPQQHGSERQLRRRLVGFAGLLGIRGASLRTHLRASRAIAITALLGDPDAPLRDVARAVGYGSERALATALRQLGLGSPTELASRIRRGV